MRPVAAVKPLNPEGATSQRMSDAVGKLQEALGFQLFQLLSPLPPLSRELPSREALVTESQGSRRKPRKSA